MIYYCVNDKKLLMTKRALITGINGQDGSYLAELLLKKGYEVFGMERKSSIKIRENTLQLEGRINFVYGDMTDQSSLSRCVKICDPDEIYNLASMSFVGESWNTPETTGNVNALGVLRILEACRELDRPVRFYQASTSEMFGKVETIPQTEDTKFYPRSPYGIAKLYGHWITKNYRESHGMYAVSGILFNHESERRGKEFVTRKISEGVAKISLGLESHILLGNIDAERDWGYAPDFVEAMWLMLQQDEPDDYIIATGKTRSVRYFLEQAFGCVGIADWEPYVKFDKDLLRPAEVDTLVGDATKAYDKLGWKATTAFESMVSRMVGNDIRLLQETMNSI